MLLTAGTHLALQLQRVSVVNQNLVLIDIGNIEQPVLDVDRQATRPHQTFRDHVFGFVFCVEYQDMAEAGIGDEQTIIIVHGQANDANEVAMGFVLDQFDFASFGVEDKDGADFLIGDIEVALGIDRHAVRLGQLPENFRRSRPGALCRRGGPSRSPSCVLGVST